MPRVITLSLFFAVLAGTWDIWWHAEIGRETFWSPPHILLYTSVIVAIAGGCYGWWQTRQKRWKWIAFVLLLIPASAPFDELWHRIFGVEQVNSPLIIWSPPHVILALILVASFLVLFLHLKRDDDVIARHLLQSIALAAIFSLLSFLVSPLDPIGPYHLLGFASAGFAAALMVLIFLFAQEQMRRFGSAVSVAGVSIVITTMELGHRVTPMINIEPHDHAPGWLVVFALLVPALFIDVLRSSPFWIQGSIAGFLHGGILYGFAWRFFAPEFQYSTPEMWTAMIASTVAGLAAGIAISLFSRLYSPSPTSV